MAKAFEAYAVGLIIREKEPTNPETPLDQVDSYLTPTELFYIRSHFPAPKLERASYQLRIDGAVRKPLSLSDKQLRDMPSETKVAALECAGNSRVFLIQQVAGVQWELGAVGNAEWTGVPLAALSIGRSIVLAHGGRLWARRNADHGLTFHLLVPETSNRGTEFAAA